MCGIRCFRKSWRSLECDRLKIQYKAHTVWEIFCCQPPAIWIMVCWLLWCLAASSIYCHLSPGTLSVSLVKYIPLSCFCSNLHYEPAPFSTGVAPQWLLWLHQRCFPISPMCMALFTFLRNFYQLDYEWMLNFINFYSTHQYDHLFFLYSVIIWCIN